MDFAAAGNLHQQARGKMEDHAEAWVWVYLAQQHPDLHVKPPAELAAASSTLHEAIGAGMSKVAGGVYLPGSPSQAGSVLWSLLCGKPPMQCRSGSGLLLEGVFSLLLTSWPLSQGSVPFLLYTLGFLDRFVLRKVLKERPVLASPWLCVTAGFFTL